MWFLSKKAINTLVLSDLHLTVAEPEHRNNPFWRKFNRKEYFVDQDFSKLLEKSTHHLKGDIELVLAGDIFDFDSVLTLPKKPDFKINWMEKKRGLNSEETKSLFKIQEIIKDHTVFFTALHDFIQKGHKVVFVIGNHDLELHWPSVKEKIISAIGLSKEHKDHVRFCNWFYISNEDTLIEHGNQYDPYCSIANPINPFFHHIKHPFIKLPFGNLSHRYMINGMGIFNPHVDTTYLLNFWGYLKFYFYSIKTQPLLLFAWFFGAMATWLVAIKDGVLPRIKNPLKLEDQYSEIAKNANAEPRMVRALMELHATPVSWNIFRILRVLWLDKAILLMFLAFAAFQMATLLNIFWDVSLLWSAPIFVLMFPILLLYARQVQTIQPTAKSSIDDHIVQISTQITKTHRLVCGHSHGPEFKLFGDKEYINSGYWSPSFKDIKCTESEKNKSFVWIKPENKKRAAKLMFWDDCAKKENPFG